MKRITILVADDHHLIRDTWSFILNSDPRFKVVAVAASGGQAVELAKSTNPDIVLMDINMGDMSGFDATIQIRKHSPGSKIIELSMHSIPAYVKKIFKLGASGYVAKYSESSELLNAIVKVHQSSTFICQGIKDIISQQELETDKSKPDINNLSKRELEIAGFIRNGMSSKTI